MQDITVLLNLMVVVGIGHLIFSGLMVCMLYEMNKQQKKASADAADKLEVSNQTLAKDSTLQELVNVNK